MNIIDYDHQCFGRASILEALRKRIQGLKDGYRQNVALLGSKTSGKSSILRKLIDDHDDTSIMLIYLDMENRNLDVLCQQFTKSLLYYYLKNKGLSPQEEIKLLCVTASDFLPQTVAAVEHIHALLQKNDGPGAYASLLALPDVFTLESGQSLVLIFDEFQSLSQLDVADAFAQLGMRIMTQKNCLYIVSSSYQAQAKAILSEKLSLLFGNFEEINVLPFDATGSQQLIDRHLSQLKMGLQLRRFLVDFSGGHPLYINILCQELISLCGVFKQEEIYAPILTQAIENLLFNPWGVLSRHFELMIHELCRGKLEGPLSSVLIAISEGKHRAADLSVHLNIKPAQVNARISALLSSEIIEKNGNYYHIKDKLFRYWIKYVYQRRLKAIDLEVGKSRKLFKEEINKAVNDFQTIARKDLAARMVDLMNKFDSESFELVGRRYKLSMFKDIEPMKLRLGAGNFIDVLSAQGEEGRWIMALKKDPLHENDLNLFLEEIKKMTPKPYKCVVVSLNGLDDNAKIRALQEKLWVWNEEEINALMHLYDEPCLIK